MAKRMTLLLGTLFVVALGCTRTAAPRPSTATIAPRRSATLKPIKRAEIAKSWDPTPPSKELTPDVTPEGGVSLTPQGTYLERFDPSGWSGLSTPKGGIGGGPPPEEEKKSEDAPRQLETEHPMEK